MAFIPSINSEKDRGLQKAMFGALLCWHDTVTHNFIPVKPHEFVAAPMNMQEALETLKSPVKKAKIKFPIY